MIVKKPDFWDEKNFNFKSLVLTPLTLPLIISNIFLDNKGRKPKDKHKLICIGNIYLGGTGKTPLTIKLFEIIQKFEKRVSVIKKYYKDQVDEQLILSKKTKLYCNKNRYEALKNSLKNKDRIIIFDDGLQDLNIKYDLSFVCFDQDKLIGNGRLIPSGPLREKISSLSKYDAIFFKGKKKNDSNFIRKVKNYNRKIKIFNFFYEPKKIKKFKNKKFLIFSGIGNPESFENLLKEYKIKIEKKIIFPDHYNYKKQDIKKITDIAKKDKLKILTTKKDFVKIKKFENKKIQFLDIDVKFKEKTKLIKFLKENL